MRYHLKRIVVACLFIFSSYVSAQICTPGPNITCTPNLKLWVPGPNYPNWNGPLNLNWVILDTAVASGPFPGCTSPGSGSLTCSASIAGANFSGYNGFFAQMQGWLVNAPYQQGLQTYGDSICVGIGAGSGTFLVNTTANLGFCNLLGYQFFGGNYTNYAHGGDAASDTVVKLFANISTSYYATAPLALGYKGQPTYLFEDGANDWGDCGTGSYSAGCLSNFIYQMTTLGAYAAIPPQYKIFGQNGTACTTTGTWVADNTWGSGIAIKATSASGSPTITCTLPVIRIVPTLAG